MSVAQLGKRSMRIIVLPLTTASRSPTHEHLTYYHFVTPPRDDKGKDWSRWIGVKAAEIWAGFGKAPEGSWKRKTFLYGERLVDRMDFEELALKSVDTSLAPKIINLNRSKEKVPEKTQPTPIIPLIYPGAACKSPLAHLQTLLEKRTPRHRRGFLMWMALAPLTTPFIVVPIIPNLPFFFCVWRSWSHWRAYKASSYLQEFLRLGAIVPKPSQELDKIYLEFAPLSPQLLTLTSCPPPPQNPSSTTTSDPNYPSELQQAPNVDDVTTTTKTNSEDLESTSSRTSSPSSPSSTAPSSPLSPPSSSEASTNQQRQQQQEEHQHDRSSDQQRRLILTREAVPAIMKLFDLRANSAFAGDVYRALEQARLRMAKDP